MLATRQFAVIIPTMQRSPLLWEQLPHYLASELVAEVVIINNVPAAIDVEHPKLRVLAQERNIYVNPAWNLGVASSTAPTCSSTRISCTLPRGSCACPVESWARTNPRSGV
ncbi:glycosyltransferase family 2 protein [Dermacoccus abyssi]|uniref:glycosyltransferase family 2 protein n=1 Tax=Dermacoccus abyssi TaxID=322596 RepID=UPI002AD53245|nr:hypothetical protein [Dermacoccus abyssi]